MEFVSHSHESRAHVRSVLERIASMSMRVETIPERGDAHVACKRRLLQNCKEMYFDLDKLRIVLDDSEISWSNAQRVFATTREITNILNASLL